MNSKLTASNKIKSNIPEKFARPAQFLYRSVRGTLLRQLLVLFKATKLFHFLVYMLGNREEKFK